MTFNDHIRRMFYAANFNKHYQGCICGWVGPWRTGDKSDGSDFAAHLEDVSPSVSETPSVIGPSLRNNILEQAKHLISTDRAKDYGDASENFANVAAFWNVLRPGVEYSAVDVALFMAALKLARLAHDTSKQDSWVDAIGYLALGSEIALKK